MWKAALIEIRQHSLQACHVCWLNQDPGITTVQQSQVCYDRIEKLDSLHDGIRECRLRDLVFQFSIEPKKRKTCLPVPDELLPS